MWVHGALSCGDDPLRKEFAAQRVAGFEGLARTFRRAVTEGELPIDTDADTLARFVQTVNFGLTVQASTGATRKDLLRVVAAALQSLAEVRLKPKKCAIFQGGAKTAPDCCSNNISPFNMDRFQAASSPINQHILPVI